MRAGPTISIAVSLAVPLAVARTARAEVKAEEMVNRAGLALTLGAGWEARYPHTTTAPAFSGGVAGDAVVGNDNFGLLTTLGLALDAGTTGDPAVDAARLWLLDLGLGVEAAPYALVHHPRVEARLHVGARAAVYRRLGCPADRCTPLQEPLYGLAGVGTVGVLTWWGEGHHHGFGLDLVYTRGRMGNLHSGRVTVELHPPVWMLRLTWSPYRGRRR